MKEQFFDIYQADYTKTSNPAFFLQNMESMIIKDIIVKKRKTREEKNTQHMLIQQHKTIWRMIFGENCWIFNLSAQPMVILHN